MKQDPQETPPPPPTWYQRLRLLLDTEWPVIRAVGAASTILTLLGLFISLSVATSSSSQTALVRTQVAIQAARPRLTTYLYAEQSLGQIPIEIDRALVDELFATVYRLAEETPGTRYSDLLESVLPITRTVPTGDVTVKLSVFNAEDVSATNAAVTIGWQFPIQSVEVQALSPWRITAGGVGSHNVSLSIDRIAGSELVVATVLFRPPADLSGTIRLQPTIGRRGAVASANVDSPSIAAWGSVADLVFEFPSDVPPSSYASIYAQIATDQTPLLRIPLELSGAYETQEPPP
jgi:hypothetical protein